MSDFDDWDYETRKLWAALIKERKIRASLEERLRTVEGRLGIASPEPRTPFVECRTCGARTTKIFAVQHDGLCAACCRPGLRRDPVDPDTWAKLIFHLRVRKHAVLPAFLEAAERAVYIAEPGEYPGTLEIVFPPDRIFAVRKVDEYENELRAALGEVFGVAPKIRCVIREQTGATT